MTIQVAASSELQQKIVRNALNRMGYDNVAVCRTGEELLAGHSEKASDIIITDERLSDQTGIELTKRIRARETEQYTPIIMLGDDFTHAEVLTAISTGINQILLKPILPERLQAKINAVKGIRRRW